MDILALQGLDVTAVFSSSLLCHDPSSDGLWLCVLQVREGREVGRGRVKWSPRRKANVDWVSSSHADHSQRAACMITRPLFNAFDTSLTWLWV